jgi:hypothetical protein
MVQTAREFQTGPDPFGRTWHVHFKWLQTGISIRHADTVDVKFAAAPEGEPFEERVIALPHPILLVVSDRVGHPLTDAWCLKIAGLHLKHMIESGEDFEKTLVTPMQEEIETYARQLQDALVAKR